MGKSILILGAFAMLFVAAAYSQVRIIHPTYRPPPQPRYPTIRTAREAGDEPLWPNRHDGINQLPSERPFIYDDIKIDPMKRYVRSLGTPSSGRTSGSSSSKGSRGHDTGPTHPGYNRRNAREAEDEPVNQFIRWPTTKDNSVPSSIFKNIDLDPIVSHAGSISSIGRLSDSTGASFVREAGATQEYSRRDTRSLHYPTLLPPFNPRPSRPWNPLPFPVPIDRPRVPIYV